MEYAVNGDWRTVEAILASNIKTDSNDSFKFGVALRAAEQAWIAADFPSGRATLEAIADAIVQNMSVSNE